MERIRLFLVDRWFWIMVFLFSSIKASSFALNHADAGWMCGAAWAMSLCTLIDSWRASSPKQEGNTK